MGRKESNQTNEDSVERSRTLWRLGQFAMEIPFTSYKCELLGEAIKGDGNPDDYYVLYERS